MRFVLILLLLFFTQPALATDGVLEINQTCAVQTGCFVGDTAGFPVTILYSGSYRLTSNLTVSDENADGISVNANFVGIDLNNFSILGPVSCSEVGAIPVTCSPSGGIGRGIHAPQLNCCGGATPIFAMGTSVRSGSIMGMGREGVRLGVQSEILNLRVQSNATLGIYTGAGSTIRGNTVRGHPGAGIFGDDGSTISGNTAYGNGLGIGGSSGTTIAGNTASRNGDGISAGAGSSASGNTTSYNLNRGIHGSSAMILDNSVQSNGGDGIDANNSTVQRNSVANNSGYGLNLEADSTYRENRIVGNTMGPITGNGGVNMGDNYCAGTDVVLASCP
jgi:parallel beta-helix repeat protein